MGPRSIGEFLRLCWFGLTHSERLPCPLCKGSCTDAKRKP
jgi:hypothetical protein